MPVRPRVEMRLRGVQLPEDTTQPTEIGVILTDRLRMVFSIGRGEEGWYAAVHDGQPETIEIMHDQAFESAAECHHALVTLMIESLPKLTRELTRALAQKEERDARATE